MSKNVLLLFLLTLTGPAHGEIRDVLRPTEQESGIVTREEMQLAEAWFNTVVATSGQREPWLDKWLSTNLPFSFQYDGTDSGALLPKWKLEESGGGGARQLSWTDPATGLHAVLSIRKSAGYPAVEWVLTFENRGTKDTPVLENIQPL